MKKSEPAVDDLRLIDTLSEQRQLVFSVITQSAVSRQIKALEDNLGLKLFERRPRSLTLTEDGQAPYRIATDVCRRASCVRELAHSRGMTNDNDPLRQR